MMTLEDFITRSNAASDGQEVFDLLCAALADLGYDRVVYTLMTDHPSLFRMAGFGVMSSYPQDWMAYYDQQHFAAIDPVPQRAFVSNEGFFWDDLPQLQNLSKGQKRLLNMGAEAGLRDGVGIPIHGARGEVAGFGIASSTGLADGVHNRRRQDKNLLSILHGFATQFHLAYSRHKRPVHRPVLSAREKDVLSWVAEGKTDNEIAEILGISTATVRFHLRNVYAKLQANDRTLAVVKAVYLGLIQPLSINGGGI